MAVVIEYKVDYDSVEAADDALKELESTNEEVQSSTSSLGGAFSGLGDQLQGFANRINVAGVGLGDLAGKSGGAVKGVKSLTTGFKALDVLLKASVIGLIVTAIVTLGVQLTKTSKGADFLRKAMATLEGVFNGVVDVLINLDKIFSRNIIDVFSKNISQSKTLAALYRDVERATISYTKSIAELSDQAEIANQKADDATLSLQKQLQFAEEASKLNLKLAQEEQALANKRTLGLKAEIAIAERRGEAVSLAKKQELADLQAAEIAAGTNVELVRLQNAQRVRQIDQDTFEQRLDFLIDFTDNQKTINERIIADDSRTFEERQQLLDETVQFTEKAFEKAFKSFDEQAGQRLDVNKLISESDAEVVSNYLRGTELSEIETTRVLEFLRERKTFTQDLADAQKDLNESREQSLDEQSQKDLERELRDVEARIEITKEETDLQIAALVDRRNLLLENEQLTQNERLAIIQGTEEAITGVKEVEEIKRSELQSKRLETESKNLAAFGNQVSQFGTAGLVANKAIGIRQATINTFQGANQALASLPPPLSFIAAAAVIANGLNNVRQIATTSTDVPVVSAPSFTPQKFYKGGINIGGVDGIDQIPAMITRGESVMTQAETRDFLPTLKAIRNGSVDPELLNGIVKGNNQIANQSPKVVEVPRDSFTIDENGFSARIIRKNSRKNIKQNMFSW